MEREKKINELFENPAVKKAVKIVGKSFENSYEIRKKLDEKAIKKGFIPIEIHTHSSPAIEIRYAKEFKNIAEKLCREMKKKGHNAVILEDAEVKKTGKHISFELPGEKKKTNLSTLLEEKTPRFLVDKIPTTTWTTYSFIPTEKTIKQGKPFLIDALKFLQKVKK